MAVQEDEKIRVQQGNDIVELIGEHVALKPQGREFVGLCPFHDDSRPSMQVSPAKQIFKCFSCGAGGDVFSFTMNYHRLQFVEALNHLAERGGIELSKTPGQRGQDGESPRQRLSTANQRALDFFRNHLTEPNDGQPVRQYLHDRGISDAMIEQFQLGFAPNQWDALAQAAHRQKLDVEAFEQAGLIRQKRQGTGYIDRLRNRVIFPICDSLGRPIAFGGRRLNDEDEPKYLNSPETELFNKSATLYGLHLAKKPIIDSGTAVIVEGYTDVIACHQAGAANVVATLGTALTHEHVKHLRRYAEKVVLVFDPDEAGQKAADRAVEIFLTGEVDVAIAMLPEGQDPADLLGQEEGLQRWQSIVSQAQDALRYQFTRVESQLDQATTVTGRQKAAEQYITRLGQLGLGKGTPAIRRSFVVQRLSELLHMPEAEVNELLRRSSGRRGAGEFQQGPGNQSQEVEPDPALDSADDVARAEQAAPTRREQALRLAERQLIGGLVRDNALFHQALSDGVGIDEAVVPAEMSNPEHRRLYQQLHDRLVEGETLTLSGWLSELASHQQHELIRIVTQADQDVDAAAGEKQQRLTEVVTSAAQAIRKTQADRTYMQNKQRLVAHGRELDPDQDPASAQQLRELIAHNRDNPSPVRIARGGA
jgi:DNA primase